MLGLSDATEFPLVVIDSRVPARPRGATKTEQSDLFQAVHGRNADSPLAVVAAATGGRLLRGRGRKRCGFATKYMSRSFCSTRRLPAPRPRAVARSPEWTPLAQFPVRFRTDSEGFHPFVRDPATLAELGGARHSGAGHAWRLRTNG